MAKLHKNGKVFIRVKKCPFTIGKKWTDEEIKEQNKRFHEAEDKEYENDPYYA